MTLENKQAMRITLIVSLVLVCIGIGAWVYQLSVGMQVTGLDNTMVWGLTVAVFFALIAGGAGLLTFCGLSEFFGIMTTEQRQRSILLAFAAMIAGGVIIIMDLGSPAKMIHLVTSLNLASYTVLDFWFFMICVVVAALYFFLVRAGKSTKAIGAIAIVISVSLIAAEGMLLMNNISHHLWASGMSVVSFLAAGFLGGSALLAVIVPEQKRLFLIALIVSALVMLSEVGASLLVGTAMSRATMLSVVAGSFSLYFYIHILVGLIIPFIVLVKTEKVTWAAVCALIGIASEKLWLLVAGEAEVMSQYHHVGTPLPEQIFGYLPTIVEVAITLGALGLGVFLFLAAMMLFKKPTLSEEIG